MKTADIRYVITPDRLAFITLLDSGRQFVVQAPYFRKVTGVSPRASLGMTTLNSVELRALGVLPKREEVSTHVDACVSAS